MSGGTTTATTATADEVEVVLSGDPGKAASYDNSNEIYWCS